MTESVLYCEADRIPAIYHCISVIWIRSSDEDELNFRA